MTRNFKLELFVYIWMHLWNSHCEFHNFQFRIETFNFTLRLLISHWDFQFRIETFNFTIFFCCRRHTQTKELWLRRTFYDVTMPIWTAWRGFEVSDTWGAGQHVVIHVLWHHTTAYMCTPDQKLTDSTTKLSCWFL